MADDESLAKRLSAALGDLPNLTEKKMFVGIGSKSYPQALEQPHTKMFDIAGRPMTGWIRVAPEGCPMQTDLQNRVRQGLDFAAMLPVK